MTNTKPKMAVTSPIDEMPDTQPAQSEAVARPMASSILLLISSTIVASQSYMVGKQIATAIALKKFVRMAIGSSSASPSDHRT